MKKTSLIVAIFLVNGCHLEKPYLHQVNVEIKDNTPCFTVPSYIIKDSHSLQILGVSIYKNSENSWQPFWHAPQQATFPVIVSGECLAYPQLKWREGTYSVLVGVSTNDGKKRYRLENTFTLQKDKAEKLTIQSAQ